MTPFRMYSLPIVALKIVMQQVDPIDLFELSLLSKKSRKKIKNCSIKVKQLEFDLTWISLKLMFNSKVLRFDFKPTAEENTEFRVINNYRFNSWSKNNEKNSIVCTPGNNNEDGLMVFEHLKDLFLIEAYKYYMTGLIVPFIDRALLTLPKAVDSILIGSMNTTEEDVMAILEHFEPKKELRVMREVTRIHEKMKYVDYLHLLVISNIPVADLLNFNCKRVTIVFNDLTSNDINIIIRHWIENNTQLERLQIHDTKLQHNFDTILEGLNALSWDPIRRDQSMEVDGVMTDYGEAKNIERNCDNLLTSVCIRNDYFELLTWKDRFPSKRNQ